MKDYIDDWAGPLMWAEKNLKEIDSKLLHKKYEGISTNVSHIQNALKIVEAWVEQQTKQ